MVIPVGLRKVGGAYRTVIDPPFDLCLQFVRFTSDMSVVVARRIADDTTRKTYLDVVLVWAAGDFALPRSFEGGADLHLRGREVV